jgi:allantoate deiminase
VRDLGIKIFDYVDQLAQFSSDTDQLTRVYLSNEQKKASHCVLDWMKNAGMTARIDEIGNVVGRYEGLEPGLPALLLGSHLDTVRNAGRYDGMLGVVTALLCVDYFNQNHIRFPFAIEVIGFCDEEGSRFGTTLIGSRALTGHFDLSALDAKDDQGLSIREAMKNYGLDPELVPLASRPPKDFLAYIELHIEQGPILESKNLAIGTVTSICGATRMRVSCKGQAGHAGTVPMSHRKDALAMAAEAILAIEDICSSQKDLVGTVGHIEASPGSVNVIAGSCRFTIDVRSPADPIRFEAIEKIHQQLHLIAKKRKIDISIEKFHDSPSVPCADWLMQQIDQAIQSCDMAPFRLPSGAGHDAMAIATMMPVGMIFVRCLKGISHNPAESITVDDANRGGQVLLKFIENFNPSKN